MTANQRPRRIEAPGNTPIMSHVVQGPTPTREAGRRGRASWIACLSAVLLVVATCGSTADVPSAQRGDPVIPGPPVTIELPGNPIVAGTSAGYLPGSPEVSPTGEMTYTLPLDVPAGVAGMEPHLALTYSSRAGSGPIGRGWSLSGGSSSIHALPEVAFGERHARWR